MPAAQDLAQRALELVRIPSVIGSEVALADYVEAWAQRRFPKEQVVRVGHSPEEQAKQTGKPPGRVSSEVRREAK
jgi:hypothetical protein